MNNDTKESVDDVTDNEKKALLNSMYLGPESYILVYPGKYVQIHTLNNKDIKIWNGITWSSVKVKMISPMSRLLLITYSDGTLIRCSSEQKGIMLTNDVLENIKNRKILEDDIKNAIRIPTTI